MNNQIYSLFPSNKVGLIFEDCTSLDNPKIRIAMLPTKDGSGEPVNFYVDLPVARVLFDDLGRIGELQHDLLYKEIEGKKGKIPAFDLFATIGQNGHRSLTISNMPDGIFIKIINKNGQKLSQSASLRRYQARILGSQLSAYIAQLDLIKLAAAKTQNNNDKRQEAADGFGPGHQDEEFPA